MLAAVYAEDPDYSIATASSTSGDEPIAVSFTNSSGAEITVNGPVKIQARIGNREWEIEELDEDADDTFEGNIADNGTVTIAKLAPGLPDTWRPYEQADHELVFSLYINIDGEYWRSEEITHTIEPGAAPIYDLTMTTNSPAGFDPGESIFLKLTNNTGDPVTINGPVVVKSGEIMERFELIGGPVSIPADGTAEVAEIEPGPPNSWRTFYFPKAVELQAWFQVDGDLGDRLWQSEHINHIVEGTISDQGLDGEILGDAVDNEDGTATITVKVNHVERWNEVSANTGVPQSDDNYAQVSFGEDLLGPATGLIKDLFLVQRPLDGGGMELTGTLLSVRETTAGVYELLWSHVDGTHTVFLEARTPEMEWPDILPTLTVTITSPPKEVTGELNNEGKYEAEVSWPGVDLNIESDSEIDASIKVQRKGSSSHPPGSGLNPAGIYMEINVTEGSLEGATTLIEVAYTLEDLPPGMKESDLRLFRYNESEGKWELCGATASDRGVDTARKVVWARVTGFSEFAVFELTEEDGETGDGKTNSSKRETPRTGGSFPILPAAGLAGLATGAAALRRRKRS